LEIVSATSSSALARWENNPSRHTFSAAEADLAKDKVFFGKQAYATRDCSGRYRRIMSEKQRKSP